MEEPLPPISTFDGILPPPHKASRRACDCCRKRKVRCDGGEPCVPCSKASIRCAYLQPPKKKGPKGLRSARVLHALRTIDDHADANANANVNALDNGNGNGNGSLEGGHLSPPLPQHPQAHFGNWGWDQQNGGAQSSPYPQPQPRQQHQQHNGTYTSPAQHTYQPLPPMRHHPHQQQQHPLPDPIRPPLIRNESSHHHRHHHQTSTSQTAWPANTHPDSVLSGSSKSPSPPSTSVKPPRRAVPPAESFLPASRRKIPSEAFLPYVQLFFDHMFQIMPVVDRRIFLDPAQYSSSHNMSPSMYCFLSALCAATVVQLDTSITQPPPLHPNKRNDDFFAEECVREKSTFDYVDSNTPLAVMTSIFLFTYFSNHERHGKAWHYIQEGVTFSDNLNLDDESFYARLDPIEAQWRRRLYWLLFITERGYAVQRRKHTRLQASVALPAVLSSEDPRLLNGFVALAHLWSAVDDSFISALQLRSQSTCTEGWLVAVQNRLDASIGEGSGDVSETQRLNIAITREWLHTLAWQMGVSHGLIWGKGESSGMSLRLDYPVEVAGRVVEILRGVGVAGPGAGVLDCHGIGMEQKLSDIAGCLADVLKCTAGDTSRTFALGKSHLHVLLSRLSSMRGKESRYLVPLMTKIEGYDIQPPNPTITSPAQEYTPTSQQDYLSVGTAGSENGWSLEESMGMLRKMSMCGNLGMPMLELEEWKPGRREGEEGGYDEMGTGDFAPWLVQGVYA